MRRRPALAAVTGVYLLAVAWITLNPFPPDPHGNGLLKQLLAAFASTPALAWIDFDVVEFTANVLMFVPMGVLFTLLLGLGRWWLALLVGVASTCFIEGVQLLLPNRYSDVRDLVANTLGTLVGIAIVALVVVVGARRRRVAAA
jgi:glycopeptide antibiotics resistance protein